MISPESFYKILKKNGINFFTGVPDSLLKEFCAYIESTEPKDHNIITANEGSALAIATGYHLATGKVPLVYMQNSGLGNTVNPLLSLADKEVYSIPLIMLIGWRGEPGVKDEPQHIKQGMVTEDLLKAMRIPYRIFSGNTEENSLKNADWIFKKALDSQSPVALLVKKGSFKKNTKPTQNSIFDKNLLSRESAISLILANTSESNIVVGSTGMISRELYEQRDKLKQDKSKDFLTVGSMGHASQIALGIARSKPKKNIICLDGDGAAIMHLGGLTTIGTSKEINLFHIILNNGAHDSVGGQPTVGNKISFTSIAKACCYDQVFGPFIKEADIIDALKHLDKEKGKRFLEIRVKKGSRKDLGRPKETPQINKSNFIKHLQY